MDHELDPEVRRPLGVSGEFGPALGPSRDWAFDIIRGHFARLGLPRGLNATWKDGGLHAALAFR